MGGERGRVAAGPVDGPAPSAYGSGPLVFGGRGDRVRVAGPGQPAGVPGAVRRRRTDCVDERRWRGERNRMDARRQRVLLQFGGRRSSWCAEGIAGRRALGGRRAGGNQERVGNGQRNVLLLEAGGGG